MLQLFGVLRPALGLFGDALRARLSVGAVSLSAGDVVAFFVTIFVSVLAARIVRPLLEEDVLPRLTLPRGVANAVSAGVNYMILLAGLLFAFSAAGLDLGRVTILAGAFGVGIGFGLQNVVNNFVSGLILLFERPFGVGDVVEVSGVSGRVRRIGIRSSTIATFDGAEVIVPNGTLIAERVTNWTFSDHRRRIELPVGVAYGSPPEQVVTLLEHAAAQHPDVLKDPRPEALLVRFGASSLDFVLSVWTRYERAGSVKSALIVAVQRALDEAGITIPLPQQELRFRAIDGAGEGPAAEPGSMGTQPPHAGGRPER
jgi:small-conductance mechanosensitive channel